MELSVLGVTAVEALSGDAVLVAVGEMHSEQHWMVGIMGVCCCASSMDGGSLSKLSLAGREGEGRTCGLWLFFAMVLKLGWR